MEQKKKQNHKLYGGFQYAFAGILTGLKQEQNMKMHVIMTILVVIAGFFFHISMTEWPFVLWSDHGTGTGKYSGRGSGGSGNRREKTTGEDCEGYGGRGGADCGDIFGCDRVYNISTESYRMDIVF